MCKDYLENFDFIYHDFMINNGIDNNKELKCRDLKKNTFKDLMINGNAIANSGVCVRRDLLIAVGGLSEEKNLIAVEDFDLWIRISLLTSKFKRIPLALGEYWSGGGNISVSGLAQLDRDKRIYDRYLDKLSVREQARLQTRLLHKEGRIFDSEGKRNEAVKRYMIVFWKGNIKWKIRALYRMLFGCKNESDYIVASS